MLLGVSMNLNHKGWGNLAISTHDLSSNEVGEGMGSHSHLFLLHCIWSQLSTSWVLSHNGNVQKKAFCFWYYMFIEICKVARGSINPFLWLYSTIRGPMLLFINIFGPTKDYVPNARILIKHIFLFQAHENDIAKWQFKRCMLRHSMWSQTVNQIQDL